MSSGTLQLCTSPIQGGPASTMVTSLLQTLVAMQCALTTPSVWPTDYGPTAVAEGLDNYDFVIVGSGSAGSVAASRLSENPNFRVLLIEAGVDPPTESEIPALFLTLQKGPYTYDYETEPNPDACLGTATGNCYWPIAKVMGGTSSIDSMLSYRGNKPKFDDWNLPNWSWQDVTKYFDLAERYNSPASNPNGRLVVNDFDLYDTCHISEMIFKGGEELGVRRLAPNLNNNNRVGYGYVRGHVENGQRMGAGKTYLSVVKSRPNIHVIKKAEVTKINFKADRSVDSVTFIYDETEEFTVGVDKEVILAAGVIGNPKLLMLSGIGPEEDLTALGIPIIRNLPGVGQNLQDQIGIYVPFQVNKGLAKSKTATESQIDTFYYFLEKYGPLSSVNILSLVGSISGETSCAFKNCRYPDVNLFQFFSQRNDGSMKMWTDSIGLSESISQSLLDANKDANMLLSFVDLFNPQSTGHIELQSANYLDKVKVFANYLDDEADVDSLLQGIKFLMELEQTNAYKKNKAEMYKLNIPECDQYEFKSENYWRCFIKYMVTSLYAPSGTTKMGLNSDSEAVVDLTLKVRGVTGLRVGGKSVLPSPIFASDTSVMIGERLAAFIKRDWS